MTKRRIFITIKSERMFLRKALKNMEKGNTMVTYKEIKGFVVEKGRLDVYIPPTEESVNWKH